jgi:hypothetical protein
VVLRLGLGIEGGSAEVGRSSLQVGSGNLQEILT